jgi:acyl transferase domain-containing protein/acyl carrier protein
MTSDATQTSRGATVLERQALAALRKMRERLEALESARSEPLAIVGIGCRLPGAPDPKAFWDLLRRGGDAVRAISPDRWDVARYTWPTANTDHRGADRQVVYQAGLLDRVDGFDAEFFGIAGREAQLMDPQQRLFLEVAWEALEFAGIPPTSLRGTRTGVFVGATTTDYLHLLQQRLSIDELDAYLVSGNSLNAIAGRVSYTLGLHGPAIAMDSACSSSLVALDRACRSVRDGESRLAIAGGVNLILTPEFLVSLARWGMLSPDGRCKTFDASADGFVRAEGCGVVLIKRLTDALSDGDRVLALIRGWAVNQDGPSSGFTVPNGLAQAGVMRDALSVAGVAPAAVGFVEAHGTGTALGDPIEMEAIASVYGEGRDMARPVLVGAVKSNVGHLESAAGVTGLIKTILALQHRQVPPNVHFREPTPHIPWSRIPVRVPTELQPWEPIGGRRLAGVSAFGISGTNAHLVLEEAPGQPHPETPRWRTPALLTISARSPAALDALALLYADRLEAEPPNDAVALGLASGAARAHLPLRLAVTGGDSVALAGALRAIGRGAEVAGCTRGRTAGANVVAFLFTGQGAQYVGMGRGLAQASPVFRAALQRCAATIDPLLGRSLLDLMWTIGDEAEVLNETCYTQPAIFAIEYALVELWRSVGVTPTLVLGHSVGEFAAACCAGVLTLEDAATLITLRARLMQALPSGGAMAAVFASEATVRARLRQAERMVAIAAINGPDETVISGDADAVRALCAAFAVEGVRTELLPVSHAFHSPLMRPMITEFEAAARRVATATPQVQVVSSMTGREADADWGNAAYWLRQLQEPVRYADAAHCAAATGISVAVEIGPHPVLSAIGRRCLPDADIAWLPSLRRERDDGATWVATLGELYVRGVVDDWTGREGAVQRAHVPLPGYPFQRARHWVDAPHRARTAQVQPAEARRHPLLGAPLALAGTDTVYQIEAGDQSHTQLREHRFLGRSIWPGTASAEMLLAAARELAPQAAIELRDLELRAPLLLPPEGSVSVQTLLHPAGDDAWRAEIYSAPQKPGETWTCVVAALLAPARCAEPASPIDRRAIEARCTVRVAPQSFYDALALRGAQFGPAFRSLDTILAGRGEALGHVRLDDSKGAGDYLLHPVLLDGCLQLAAIAAGDDGPDKASLLFPKHAARVRCLGRTGTSLWCHAVMRPHARNARTLVADLTVWGEDGAALAQLEGVRFERLPPSALGLLPPGLVDSQGYEIAWQPRATRTVAAPKRWLLLVGNDGLGELLAQALRADGAAVALYRLDDADAAVTLAEANAAIGGAPDHIVHMGALDLPSSLDAVSPLAALRPALESALRLVQAAPGAQSTRLWFITRHAQAVRPGEAASPLAAALWGFGRVVRAERPELDCTLLDLDEHSAAVALANVLQGADARETQLALRDGQAWAARIVAMRDPGEFRISAPRPGAIEDLTLVPFAPRVPGPGEIRIAVQAAGLNFRDVLCALGMYPGTIEALGGECAGVVDSIGPGVTAFGPGDDVIAFAPGSLATSVVVPAHFAARRPTGLTPEQAAALPVAYLTASYGLEDIAALRRGERVLIHSAAGGVGLAALRIAQLVGAEIYATAGSQAKRDELQALGVHEVLDSRSLAFRDAILDHTRGEGVHVVLNALSGDFIPAGLSLLKPGGRFLEMGKRGIWSEEDVQRHFPGVLYRPFDLGDEAARDPALVPRLFERLLSRLESGELQPLPLTVHALEAPHAAFDAMVHARHTGKLVLRRERGARAVPMAVLPNASYLVTGGFGALGLAVAEGLVARGARHLVLVGRTAPSAQAEQTLARLATQGVAVRRAQFDVADPQAVRTLIRDMSSTAPPLRGVVHAAGVLADGVISQLDWPRFETVLRPKLEGALNLAAATAGIELDFFVLFSSGAAWLGAPGQANYAAANAALDAMAQTHRAARRCASAIAWGRWSGAGMAGARNEAGERDWAAMGVGGIPVDQGIAAMFDLIEHGPAVASVLPIDWAAYLTKVYGAFVPRLFSEVLPTPGETAASRDTLMGALLATPVDRRRDALLGRLEALVRKVVGVPASQTIDARRPVRDLGMDSLMSVELRNAIARALERTLPATLLFDHPTPDALADYLLALLPGLHEDAVEIPARPAVSERAAAIHALSEDEAEAQLLRELSNKGAP